MTEQRIVGSILMSALEASMLGVILGLAGCQPEAPQPSTRRWVPDGSLRRWLQLRHQRHGRRGGFERRLGGFPGRRERGHRWRGRGRRCGGQVCRTRSNAAGGPFPVGG